MMELPFKLQSEYRMKKPQNAACTEAMYALGKGLREQGRGEMTLWNLSRYSVMLQCWETTPNLRLSFTDIVESLSSHLAALAEYIPMMEKAGGQSDTPQAESSV